MTRTLPAALVCAVLALGAGSGTGAAQGKSVLTARDHLDIQQLYARAAQALDSADGEALTTLFTEDGEIVGVGKGRDALLKEAGRFAGRSIRHWTANLVLTPTPWGADGRCDFMVIDVRTKAVVQTGVYEDVLLRTTAGWRFKQRNVSKDDEAQLR